MLVFENRYQNLTPSLGLEIEKLWRNEYALGSREIQERLSRVVMIARDSASGALAGVSTAEKRLVPALNNHHLYEFRGFISSAFRVAGSDIELARQTFDFLESIRGKDASNPIGIISILEDETLKQDPVWRRAVWPELGMHLVGFTNSGNPIRVHYFKQARI